MTGEVLGQRKRRRRREPSSNVVFHWERRAVLPEWAQVRHAGSLLALAAAVAGLWGLGAVSTRRRRIEATRAAIASVERAVESFRADHGRCPSGIARLVNPPQRSELSPRYLAEARADGWGHPLELTCPGVRRPGSADVRSQGIPDGLLATGTIE
ncbi:MAG: type II secretion system protein GspG [Polyangiales bacterium]